MGVPRLNLAMAPGIRSAHALAGLALGLYVRRNFRSRGAITARRPRVPASVILARPNPSQQAAYLPCSRPPDCAFCARPRRAARRSVSSARHTHRAFVVTRSGADTMSGRHGSDDDDITLAPAAGGRAAGGARHAQTTPPPTSPSASRSGTSRASTPRPAYLRRSLPPQRGT
jgi:hypothetical protein